MKTTLKDLWLPEELTHYTRDLKVGSSEFSEDYEFVKLECPRSGDRYTVALQVRGEIRATDRVACHVALAYYAKTNENPLPALRKGLEGRIGRASDVAEAVRLLRARMEDCRVSWEFFPTD